VQRRVDREHTKLRPVNKYEDSKGYQKLLEHHSDLVKQGWRFEGNCALNYKRLGLSSPEERVEKLRELGLEACAVEPTYNPDGSIKEGGKVIFVRGRRADINPRVDLRSWVETHT